MALLFERLNLRYNPFRTPPPEEWPLLAVPVAGFEPDELAEWLKTPRRAVLLMGEAGRGKSTHMKAIHRHEPDAPWVYVGPGEDPDLPDAPLVFIDEVQRIGWWRRRKLWRRDASFVIGSHVDYRKQMARAGLQVECWSLDGLYRPRLLQILTIRVERARRGPGPVPTFTDEAVNRLLDEFGDDLRAMLDVLYDYFQSLESVGELRLDDAAFRAALRDKRLSAHRTARDSGDR